MYPKIENLEQAEEIIQEMRQRFERIYDVVYFSNLNAMQLQTVRQIIDKPLKAFTKDTTIRR